uniref:Uncharacterized protein TCIL3000_6_1630 n=1 Tax=Trypanosoma congolense (strain IL3000) TaxID=1068625 RepID=G0UNG9_TRYCI|nr:unnamed protein product [Trypanosoma congolense IL3000]
MRKLNHKHIVKYYSSRRDEDCTALLIYMEYISGGTIASKLKANGPFNEEETRVYTKQLLKGLSYLHRRRIIHRDLKGDNLFVTTDGILKVGDFGTSKDLQATVETNSVAGTPNFMAPEVINCSGHSYMADIWSVGCCVLEMLSGHPPFWKLDNCMAVMFAILRGELEKHIPDHLSEDAADFISQCTRTNPKERLTASQLLRHPWIIGARGGASVRSESAMGYSLTSASFQDDRIAAFDRRKASTSPCDSTELSRVSLYSSHFCPTQVAARGQDSERLLECESAPKSCMSSARRHLSFSHSSSTIAIAMDRSPIVPRRVRRRSAGKSVTITTGDALPPIVGG